MASTVVLWVGRVLVLLQLIPAIVGWGMHGHYATCKIAEAYLSKEATEAVKELLPEYAEGELASVCSWADHMHFHYPWSSSLHYIDTPDFRCTYDYCRDCHDEAGRKDRCVAGAINNYTLQLVSADSKSAYATGYNLTEALMFLAHFVGDIHQPLHVGFTGDLGGNRILVHWYRRKANLHHVWDTAIIDTAIDRFYGSELSNMIEAIQRNITESWMHDVSSWASCSNSNSTVCPDEYASESIKLACKYAYRNAAPGSTLEDEYFLSRLPIVEKRLAQGGIRLAATLNRIFNTSKSLVASL